MLRSKTLTPVTSDGSKSEVNSIRRCRQSTEAATALPRLVLPTPGTSSMRRCPPAIKQVTAWRMADSLPWMTLRTLRTMAREIPSAAPRL